MVSGGAALVAGSIIAGTGTLAPVVGALLFGQHNQLKTINAFYLDIRNKKIISLGSGATLLGGSMVAESMCLGIN